MVQSPNHYSPISLILLLLFIVGLYQLPKMENNILPPFAQVYTSDSMIIHPNFTRLFDYDVCLVSYSTLFSQVTSLLLYFLAKLLDNRKRLWLLSSQTATCPPQTIDALRST